MLIPSLAVLLVSQTKLAVPEATGASIDESGVTRTLVVDPVRGPYKSLLEGFREAHRLVAAGTPTRLTIRPGTYREAVVELDWSAGKAALTPLVIEGSPGVVWTGADVFPTKEWRKERGLWVHDWPHQWGNFAYSWSAKRVIGHRSEMAFLDGQPLFPRLLETYTVDGIVQDPDRPGQVSHKFTALRHPETTLLPGQFGVIERAGNPRGIYLRLPNGAAPGANSIEVAVRRNLLDLRGKSNLVLRNITFQSTANSDADFGSNNPVRFSIDPAKLSNNVLIDRCKVLWSAQTGLHIDGNNWTIRDSEFNYNGGSGIASGKSTNILWERNRTNFNVWRLWLAGELGYYTGGFKMHEATRHTIRGHEAIGNCTMGAWWDVHCRDVSIRDLVAVGNAANLQFELCEGPFVAERILLAAGRAGDAQLRMWEHGATSLRHSILYSNYYGSGTTGLYDLRWFGRDDVHSRMNKITAGENLAEGNVFVAGPNVARFAMIDDIRGPQWSSKEPMSYRGVSNVFWSPKLPDFKDRWIKDDDRKGDLAARAISVEQWKRSPTYQETDARFLNPEFENLETYDFRFRASSPLFAERTKYPQYVMPKSTLREWRRFCAWLGYQPDAWNEPATE